MPNKQGLAIGDYVTKSGVELDDVRYGIVTNFNANKITVTWSDSSFSDEEPAALRYTTEEIFRRRTGTAAPPVTP